ncbi:T9SS type A sorting domain-containing protein [Marinilabilia rubra]|uniref:Secretion system C-terminal sorting domain-containing protein n=1 Tax=Marinilabilia rubra TaxID=2162893 RepID=A0A2U2B762_9BACT|nr:T9SS type A sorting domain-containing protein [Marinilabilia rubra]PWD98919.1 hypothetical protein DDZ16_13035 [Marinilabilia rubra]
MVYLKIVFLWLILILSGFDLPAQTVIWESEGENGNLAGTAEINEGCDFASQDAFVKMNSDAGNQLTFQDVEVPSSGTYQLVVHYFYVGAQPLEVFVNGISMGVKEFPSAHWCYQGVAAEYSMDIDLNEGINEVSFQTANGLAGPFIDKVQVLDATNIYLSFSDLEVKMVQGQTVHVAVEMSGVLNQEVRVSLSVPVDGADFIQVDQSTVTIPSGNEKALIKVYAPLRADKTDQTVLVQLSNPTSGVLLLNDQLTLQIAGTTNNYYVSSTTGNDNNDGLTPETPWKTLAKVSEFSYTPGDSVLFFSGDEFTGQLKINSSGIEGDPLVFSRYGPGNQPVLNGAGSSVGDFESTVFINNQSFIELQDLEITNDRKTSRSGSDDKVGYGIFVLNDGLEVMQHFRFEKLTIRDVFAVSTEGVEFNQLKVAGIYFRSERNTVAGEEKHIRDVLVDSCYITHTGKFGIWSQHAGGKSGIGNDSINRNMNLVFSNNHMFETGGSGITPGGSYNCLVENNTFEYTGSDADPRMAKRGSGAWFFNCRNVIAQYNKSLHVRGPADSYGMHIDFGNRNVILQYNYSEDSEGGFVEILGKNVNSVYRFNVSVNDGIRDKKGNTLWVSDYAGTNNKVLSDSNFIYNNTIYVDAAITPDISINAKNTFVYNNIFYAGAYASIGNNTDVNIETGSELKMSNNLFKGNINSIFANMDKNPVFGDPFFVKGGESETDSYYLGKESEALGSGISFPEPQFPMAGKGIFKDVDLYPQLDFYGNPVNVSNSIPNIGAYNGEGVGDVGIDEFEIIEATSLRFYPNPAKGEVFLSIKAEKHGTVMVLLSDLQGRELQREPFRVQPGNNTLEIQVSTELKNGIYLISMEENGLFISKRLLLVR